MFNNTRLTGIQANFTAREGMEFAGKQDFYFEKKARSCYSSFAQDFQVWRGI